MKRQNPPHFLLVGNAPLLSKGCEAILRTTVSILEEEFGEITITAASFGDPTEIVLQAAQEKDSRVHHLALSGPFHTYSKAWWQNRFNKLLGHRYRFVPFVLNTAIQTACVALEIGGDNYSLDYGPPTKYMDMDRYLQRHHVPVVLWGASVGPFEARPKFLPGAINHLRSLTGILVRESVSYAYLRGHGVTKHLHQVCDPAFLLKPEPLSMERLGFTMPTGALGLSLSPLMSRYVTDGNLDAWIHRCMEIVIALSHATERPIVLIPHGLSRDPSACDHHLAQVVYNLASGQARAELFCIGNDLSAAETKWVISQCHAFCGARTHATIAAISSFVPTLSFAYSNKARGLNLDVFGSLDYCMEPHTLTSSTVTERVCSMLGNADNIRRYLQHRLPDLVARARSAGPILRRIMEEEGL